jgi:hypothetical protein
MPTNSPALKSDVVRVSRYVLADILKQARMIAACDKSPHLADSGSAYAHALGRCNGAAKEIAATLEYLGVR